MGKESSTLSSLLPVQGALATVRMYGEGISRTGELVDLGVELDLIKKSGSWFSYADTKLGQGRDAVKGLMLDNPELAQEIETKIVEVLNGAHMS